PRHRPGPARGPRARVRARAGVFFPRGRRHTRSVSAFLLNRSSDLNVRSSLMAVNIHITIIELHALHTKRQNLFQELDAVIHLLMEAKHWGLRKSRNA